jgi:hypothetical protein
MMFPPAPSPTQPDFWRTDTIPKKKTGRSRSTAHPAKTKSKIRQANRESVFKKKGSRTKKGSNTNPDKTIMTVNGRQIKQDGQGKMYVMKNDRKTYI